MKTMPFKKVPLFIFLLIFSFGSITHAQLTAFWDKHQPAEFPGGMEALKHYFNEALNYPEEARANAVEGIVIIRFVIKENGEIHWAKVIKSLGYGCDKEALRAIMAMPIWEPAKSDGQNIRSIINIPIHFELSGY